MLKLLRNEARDRPLWGAPNTVYHDEEGPGTETKWGLRARGFIRGGRGASEGQGPVGTEYKRCRGGVANCRTNEATGVEHCSKMGPTGGKRGSTYKEKMAVELGDTSKTCCIIMTLQMLMGRTIVF